MRTTTSSEEGDIKALIGKPKGKEKGQGNNGCSKLSFADKLVGAPAYIEQVAVPNAVGKVVKAEWDSENLWYEAEI